jgi:hypothetical protein
MGRAKHRVRGNQHAATEYLIIRRHEPHHHGGQGMARIKALSPHDGKGKAFNGIIGERLAAEHQQ